MQESAAFHYAIKEQQHKRRPGTHRSPGLLEHAGEVEVRPANWNLAFAWKSGKHRKYLKSGTEEGKKRHSKAYAEDLIPVPWPAGDMA